MHVSCTICIHVIQYAVCNATLHVLYPLIQLPEMGTPYKNHCIVDRLQGPLKQLSFTIVLIHLLSH